MKETNHKNTQRQIANLIPMIELCLPLIKEVEWTQTNLSCLPERLKYLKKQAQYLNLKASLQNTDALHDRCNLVVRDRNFKIEETEFELDFLVSSLDDTLLDLAILQNHISDLVVLRERLEALQEERLDNITPERIYKLIEKQQQLDSANLNNSPSNDQNYLKRIWQKTVNYKHAPKITRSAATIAGIILCFSVFSYTSMKYQINEANNAREVELKKMPQDI